MVKDNVDLICSVAELTGLFTGSRNLQEFLQRVVETVAQHMNAAVCSIYLYSEPRDELILRATVGLSPDSIGKVRLKIGEGIVGTAMKELRAIREDRGSRNPNYKFIPGIEEEKYEAFLAVPILRGLSRVGALVVQHGEPGYFDRNDSKALRAIASQLASAIESAKLLMSLNDSPSAASRDIAEQSVSGAGRQFIKGNSGSEGVAFGALVFHGVLADEQEDSEAFGGDAEYGIAEFEQAVERTERQLEALEAGAKEQALDIAAGMIFSAHLLMLRDDAFAGAIRQRIEGGMPAHPAIRDVVQEFAGLLAATGNARMREKVQDVRDLGHRLIHNLRQDTELTGNEYEGRVVVAGDILPAQMLRIAARKAAGLILTAGGFTAHMAILARSLGIPLVFAKDSSLASAPESVPVLIDAAQGTIYLNPAAEVMDQYREYLDTRGKMSDAIATAASETWTEDGRRVHLQANLNLLSELEIVHAVKAEGIGLYRSEFPYIVRNDFPSEEELFRIYRRIVEAMEGREVVFRTLDVGGDKMLSYFPSVSEANPFLGLRAIRFSLRHREIFDQQLRALLRAGAGAELSIMFPLVSSVDDFLAARRAVRECIEELENERMECNASPRLGIMVELPAAVELADAFAAEADFLCIGTNDLIQYMLAADRTNQQISEYYVPHHPAVLRALKRVATAAAAAGKPVSLCGELATDHRLVPYLLGIGITKLSMDARRIPEVQRLVSSLQITAAEEFADRLLRLPTVTAVEEALGKA